MKILAISCMHGKIPRNFEAYVRENDINTIISMGDHCDGDERRSLIFKNWDHFKGRDDYYKAFEELIGKDECKTLHEKYALSGKDLLEKLDSLGIPVLVLYGNNDFTDDEKEDSGYNFPTLEEIVKSSKNLKPFDGQTLETDGFRIAGIGGYRDVPRSRPLEPGEEEKYGKLNQLFREKLDRILNNSSPEKTILIGHDQPRDTDFDKVNYPSSPAHGKSVGDELIREYLDKYHPAVYIGGHMHEHHGISKLGSTTLVAAGHGRDGQCVIFEIPSLDIKPVTIL